MKPRLGLTILAFVLILLVIACEGPVSSTPTAQPAPTSVAIDPLIVLATSGAIAGVQRELRISPAGEARLYDKGAEIAVRQMTPTSLSMVQGILKDVDFFNLQERYDNGKVSDDTYYALTYTGAGRTKTVTIADTGGQGLTPNRLLDAIAKLTQLEQQMRNKGR